ncbi:MAG: MATE family efflux transporter [Clostridia bacterium]|nr:MATE family efflux transporter [Clostridia bacterium]
MSASVRDMTVGKPYKHIIAFALPLMLGNIFQQLYTMTDAAIVGQFAGVEALAAVGAADWLSWLVFGVVSGFAQGFSILTSQRFGAQDEKGLRKAVAMSVVLAAIIAVAFTIVSILATNPLLKAMNTPENVFGMSSAYLYILYAGITITMTYNMLSSILRALGNSRAPLIAMVCASVTNIALDLVFVIAFKWGVAGAAAATVIAQAVASFVCFLAIRKVSALHMHREDWQFDRPVAKELMRLSTPMAFQNCIIAVGGMAVQRVVNGFGFIFVAGFTATNKLYGLLEVAATSFGFSMATFSGQNLGAGRLDRIRKGTNSALIISTLVSVGIAVIMFFCGRWILSLFISASAESAAEVLDVAVAYLNVMAAGLFVLYYLYVYRSALQGMGDTFMPMLSGIVEFIMRLAVAFTIPAIIGANGVFLAEPAAWLGATVLLGSAYYYRVRKLERERQGALPLGTPPKGQ